MLKKFFFFILLIKSLNLIASEKIFKPKINLEYGRLKIIKNSINFGEEGSQFDFIKEGGQENLYPHMRFSLESPIFSKRIFFKILYQSFFLETYARLKRNVSFDNKDIAEETAIDCQYNFPYTRLSFFYTWSTRSQKIKFGPSIQIRNASIAITTANGNTRIGRQGVGVVGVLSFVYEYDWDNISLKTELDGIGRIQKRKKGGYLYELSSSLIKKYHKDYDILSGLRYFTGGYAGQNSSSSALSGTYTQNYIESLSFFLGLVYKI